MKPRNQPVRTLVIATAVIIATAIASAEDAKPPAAPKLVNETKIFDLDESRDIRENRGLHSMRLSPDAALLLYIQRMTFPGGPATPQPRGVPNRPPRPRRGYRLVLRDIKTAKDTTLPGAPFRSDDFAVMFVSMRPFSPDGKKLILPVGTDEDGDGIHNLAKEKMDLVLYDVASGKTAKLDLASPILFPTFSGDGKQLIVLAMVKEKQATLHVAPVAPADKIKFKQLGIWGLPRSPCPAAPVLPLLLPPARDEGQEMRRGSFILYDIKADKRLAVLPTQSEGKLDDYNPQWTADGRYLYYYDIEEGTAPDGGTRRKTVTRVWDRTKSVETAIIEGVVPVGPAPGKSTVVLMGSGSGGTCIHDAAAEKMSPLPEVRFINAQGRFLVYVRQDKDGKKSVYRAEIK